MQGPTPNHTGNTPNGKVIYHGRTNLTGSGWPVAIFLVIAAGVVGVLWRGNVLPFAHLQTSTGPAYTGTDNLQSISFTSDGQGWIAGDNGTLLHLVNGTWTQASSPANDVLNSIALTTGGTGWAVGRNGIIEQLSGGTWKSVTSPAKVNLNGVALASATEGWA